MEKYSAWRDQGTGIPPFLPERLGSTVNVVKVVLKTVSYWLVCLLSALLVPFIGSESVYCLRLNVLYSIGYELSIDGLKKREINKEQHYPRQSELYVVNALSPFDGAILASLSRNQKFNLIVPRQDSLYLIRLRDWYQFAIEGALWQADHVKLAKIEDLETTCSGRVNFLFAEGTTSNGKSVLPFEISESLLQQLADICGNTRCISLKLNSKLTTPLQPTDLLKYKLACISLGVKYKIRISATMQNHSDVKALRTSLCGGDEYRLVGKKLDLRSKEKFSEKYYS